MILDLKNRRKLFFVLPSLYVSSNNVSIIQPVTNDALNIHLLGAVKSLEDRNEIVYSSYLTAALI